MHNRSVNFGKYSFFTSFNGGNTLLTAEKEGEASFMKLDKNDILLFSGDSITDGNRGKCMDCNHIMGHGYQYIVASQLALENAERARIEYFIWDGTHPSIAGHMIIAAEWLKAVEND